MEKQIEVLVGGGGERLKAHWRVPAASRFHRAALWVLGVVIAALFLPAIWGLGSWVVWVVPPEGTESDEQAATIQTQVAFESRLALGVGTLASFGLLMGIPFLQIMERVMPRNDAPTV